MFKIEADPKFTHDVTVCVPVDGGHANQTFKVTFRVVDIDQLGDTSSLEAQQELLRKIVCGMDDMIDDADQPVPYSDALRDQLIAKPYVRAAMIQTYLSAITKTKLGN